jgi:hypothetical protein
MGDAAQHPSWQEWVENIAKRAFYHRYSYRLKTMKYHVDTEWWAGIEQRNFRQRSTSSSTISSGAETTTTTTSLDWTHDHHHYNDSNNNVDEDMSQGHCPLICQNSKQGWSDCHF